MIRCAYCLLEDGEHLRGCPGWEPEQACPATMRARSVPDHTHTCDGSHDDGAHYCPGCDRWWWERRAEPEPTFEDREAQAAYDDVWVDRRRGG
jgi:hypothetical protein